LIVAGSLNYTGAAALCGMGALRAGAGLVTIATIPAVRAAIVPLLPEATYLPLREADGAIDGAAGDVIARAIGAYDALLIGPGMGTSPGAQAVVRGLLTAPAVASVPVVIDADALNALARSHGWHGELKCRAVLTPHPGELARLAGSSAGEVQKERLAIARRCAEDWRQTVVLKGAHTIIAQPDGRALISPFANALLATAGTGDILAGAVAGLVAQGVEPLTAAGLGVYLHGAAGASLAEDYGPSGLLASELGAGIARAAARLRRDG
jgi:NAD(P)H-hydrate epimerase